jgi:hypothetical protein
VGGICRVSRAAYRNQVLTVEVYFDPLPEPRAVVVTHLSCCEVVHAWNKSVASVLRVCCECVCVTRVLQGFYKGVTRV